MGQVSSCTFSVQYPSQLGKISLAPLYPPFREERTHTSTAGRQTPTLPPLTCQPLAFNGGSLGKQVINSLSLRISGSLRHNWSLIPRARTPGLRAAETMMSHRLLSLPQISHPIPLLHSGPKALYSWLVSRVSTTKLTLSLPAATVSPLNGTSLTSKSTTPSNMP